MRRLITAAYLLGALLLCSFLNSVTAVETDYVIDGDMNEIDQIGTMEVIQGIPLESLDPDKPYTPVMMDNGDDPIYSMKNNGVISSSNKTADQASLLDSNLNITDLSVTLQGVILNDIITGASFPSNTVTVHQGTGSSIKADLTKLSSLVKTGSGDVSFLAVRLEDGAMLGYNVDKYYQSCSTIKAPASLYVSKLISEGKLDWNKTLTYTSSYYISGTGVIKNYKYGTKFTIKKLVEYSILESDNIAHNMLCSAVGVDGFYKMMTNMNIKFNDGNMTNWPDSSARGSALWWNEIYAFSHTGSTGTWLWNTLGKTYSKIGNALGNAKTVYSKTGSSTYCSHEGGVVMGDKPYIIIMLTKSKSDSYFSNLAREIDKVICS